MPKATWLFNGSAADEQIVFGFSESWYTNLTGDALINAMDTVSDKRRLLLAADTNIVGYRIQDATGRSFVVRKKFIPPRANGEGNVPVDSILCEVAVAGTTSKKRFWCHDVPDDWIVGGRLPDFVLIRVTEWLERLSALNFGVRYRVQSAPTAPILSIDATGAVVTSANIVLAAGDTIQFLRCRDINGRPIKGTYVVKTVTDQTHFAVAPWAGQLVGVSGRVRKLTYQIGGALVEEQSRSIVRSGSRKVGRPFFQLRGRASARR